MWRGTVTEADSYTNVRSEMTATHGASWSRGGATPRPGWEQEGLGEVFLEWAELDPNG